MNDAHDPALKAVAKADAPNSDIFVDVEELLVSFGGTIALDRVSFSLGTTVTALVGVNGAGKSTLLRSLAGAQKPTSGRVLIQGNDAYARSTRSGALQATALMPQDARFPSRLSVLEVVSYVAWMRGLSSSEATTAAVSAVRAVGLADHLSSRMKVLSGGMNRRVALAQALVSSPAVLLLDEPSTGLDPAQRRNMVNLLSDISGCVLVSSHVMEDVADLAERVIVLDSGRVLFDGPTAELRDIAPGGVPKERALEIAFLNLVSSHASQGR